MTGMCAMHALRDLRDSVPDIAFGVIKNGFGSCGYENDHRNACNFEFKGRIYLKVEHACLYTCSGTRFLAPNLKLGNTFTQKL